MHPMTVVMGCFSHLFFTCSSPEGRRKWKGKPVMHQMVHMKWYEPQGAGVGGKLALRLALCLGFAAACRFLGLKVLTEVDDPRSGEES